MKKFLIISFLLISSRLSAQPITALQPAIASLSLNANNTAAPQVGTAFAIPQSCNTISWIISFGSAPASVNTNLEFSNDNSVWETGDTSTNINGESRSLLVAARFVRANETARSGGTAITVSLVCKGGIAVTNNNFVLNSGQFLAPNGSASAPSYSFTSNHGSGLYITGINWGAAGAATDTGISRSGVATLSVGNGTASDASGTMTAASFVGGNFAVNLGGSYNFAGRGYLTPGSATGLLIYQNQATTSGITIKADALPSVSACGAGSPAIIAGSTPISGAVTIGTTAVATCTITFNGTAFPSAPHCSGSVETTTAANTRAMGYSASATVLTIVPSAAWVDSSVVNWICVSSK